jgi:hypothetical protein
MNAVNAQAQQSAFRRLLKLVCYGFTFQTAKTVIASEAKQSISPHEERMDCFVASLLAMTAVSTYSGVIVRLDRTIQYAAASRFHRWRLWNTGSPLSRG